MDTESVNNVTISTTSSTETLVFNLLPVDEFIVVVTVSGIFLLGLPLNLLVITSIIARSVHRTVDAIDTYVLNCCLAYLWMLLFSLLPFLVTCIKGEQWFMLAGNPLIGCLSVSFLRRYPLYVLGALVTGLSVHACRAAPTQRPGARPPPEWTSILAICVAWMVGLIAAIEIFVYKIVGRVGEEVCMEERNEGYILFYVSRVLFVLITCFLPALCVLFVIPLACCHLSRATRQRNTHKKCTDDGFPMYRLNSCPHPIFTAGHITLAFFICLIHVCCLTPLIASIVVNTVDETFMAANFASWMPYFECVHYGPTFLVPLIYIIVLSASKRK